MESCLERIHDYSWPARQLDGEHCQSQFAEGRHRGPAPRTGEPGDHISGHRDALFGEEPTAMIVARPPAVRDGRYGFSLIELLVGLVIGMIVLSGVVQMMIVQGRGYRKQREVLDIRETGREAAALLAWDLRQSVVGGSSLATMGAGTAALRSPRGLGTVCAKHPLLARYGLWKTGGNILAGVDDSALVYQLGRDKW